MTRAGDTGKAFGRVAALVLALIRTALGERLRQEAPEIVLGAHACALLTGIPWSRRLTRSRSSWTEGEK